MTADTRPVAMEAALDRLREVLTPGTTVLVDAVGLSRGREYRHLRYYVVSRRDVALVRLTRDVGDALGFRWSGVHRAVALPVEVSPFGVVTLNLSSTLFGEPGQLTAVWL